MRLLLGVAAGFITFLVLCFLAATAGVVTGIKLAHFGALLGTALMCLWAFICFKISIKVARLVAGRGDVEPKLFFGDKRVWNRIGAAAERLEMENEDFRPYKREVVRKMRKDWRVLEPQISSGKESPYAAVLRYFEQIKGQAA